MNHNIAKIIREENEYDPRFSGNGGSYYQPTTTLIFKDGSKLILSDSSCGDFGSRYYVTLMTDGKVLYAAWGSMLPEDQWHSQIDDSELIGIIENITGHRIPSVSEIKHLQDEARWARYEEEEENE